MNPDPLTPNPNIGTSRQNRLSSLLNRALDATPPKTSPINDADPFSESDLAEYDRERDLIYQDLASDADDFARSEEEGWYYSDED